MNNTVRVSDATSDLVSKGMMSEETAARLSRNDREVAVSVSPGFENPVFSLFLIDASGSMRQYRDAVIDGQSQVLIPSLRRSRKCRKRALYIAQTIFSDEVKVLNRAARLGPDGEDDVALLDRSIYNPQETDLTALYQTVFFALQEMAAIVHKSREKNIPATFTIGVLTDGKDKCGGVTPDEIKKTIAEFESRRFLRKSTIIGAVSAGFTSAVLDEMRVRLGFQDAISLAATPQEIRRAFDLLSQSAQSAF